MLPMVQVGCVNTGLHLATKNKKHCNKVHLFTVIFYVLHERKYGENTAISAPFLIIPHKSLFVNPLRGTFCTIVFRCTFAQRNGKASVGKRKAAPKGG